MTLIQKLFSLETIKGTLLRFPLSVLCALMLFVLVLGITHDWINSDDEIMGKIAAMCVCGFFWFGAGKIFTEREGWKAPLKWTLTALGAAFLFSVIWFSAQWASHLLFLIPALLLSLMVSAYTSRGDDLSFWAFNKELWSGALMALIAGIILGGGLSAALASVNYLFGLDVSGDIFRDIWAFSSFVFTPIYALSFVAKSFDIEPQNCDTPPALSFLVNWVLAPLGILYLVILYAYFVRILIIGELPKGQLSYMISGLAGLGIVTYLAGWPLRETGTPHLKLLYKWFFPALIIPIGMQAVSIFERIHQYGVTHDRYFIVMTAVWLASIAIVFALKKAPLKIIPAILAFLLLFASFGPWSASNVSRWSQASRLEQALESNGLLGNGTIVKATEEIPFEARKNISSIVEYLGDNGHKDILIGYLSEDDKKTITEGGETDRGVCDVDRWNYACEEYYMRLIGFELVSKYMNSNDDNARFLQLDADYRSVVTEITGYDYVFNIGRRYFPHNKEQEMLYGGGQLLKYQSSNRGVKVYGDSIGEFDFDIQTFVHETQKESGSQHTEPLLMVMENDQAKVKIQILRLYARKEGEDVILESLLFNLYLGLK